MAGVPPGDTLLGALLVESAVVALGGDGVLVLHLVDDGVGDRLDGGGDESPASFTFTSLNSWVIL